MCLDIIKKVGGQSLDHDVAAGHAPVMGPPLTPLSPLDAFSYRKLLSNFRSAQGCGFYKKKRELLSSSLFFLFRDAAHIRALAALAHFVSREE